MNKEHFHKYHQDYLNSDEWQWVRSEVIQRDKKCLKCQKPFSKNHTFDVHHMNYNHLGDCDINEVDSCILLCRVCHDIVHGREFKI